MNMNCLEGIVLSVLAVLAVLFVLALLAVLFVLALLAVLFIDEEYREQDKLSSTGLSSDDE